MPVQNPVISFLQRYLLILIPLLFIFIAIEYGVFTHKISLGKAILLLLSVTCSLSSFLIFYEFMRDKNDSLGIQREAPGIDGSAGGWRLTPASTMLLVTILFAIPVVLLTYKDMGDMSASSSAANDPSKKKTDSTGNKQSQIPSATDSTHRQTASGIDSVALFNSAKK